MSAKGTVENIRLGTCNVYFGEAGTEISLGFTIGGVEVEVTTETQATMVDQFGDTVVKESIRGRNVVVRTQLAESTIDNMVKVMPGSRLVGTVSKKAVVSTGTGIDLLAISKQLLLRPVEKDGDTPDKSEDFLVYRASTPGGLNFAYSKDSERVFNTEFKAYPNAEGELYEYGDPDAA